jgi:tetratricopeptide (TPR) repeat protein
MNKLIVLTALALGSSACAAEAEPAKANPPRTEESIPRQSIPRPDEQAAHAWQTSYAAESAGDLQGALTALAQLPAPQSTGYLASFRRGWLQYRLGKYADSVAAYNIAILLEPANVEARVAQLASFMALSKWNDIIQAAPEVLRRDPENYLALQRLTFAKFNTQHFAEAEQMYRHLVQLYPSDIEMRAGLAWTLLRMGKQKEAQALFAEVLELSPHHASAQAGLKAASMQRRAPARSTRART